MFKIDLLFDKVFFLNKQDVPQRLLCGFLYLILFFRIVSLIRLWDIECGACLRVLEGHEELVRCIRFDSKRIVSGAYDG